MLANKQTTLDPESKILIAGAGPAGLSLALFLSDTDLNVSIFEKATAPHNLNRATGLQPRIFPLLSDLGVLEEALSNAQILKGNRVYLNGKFIFSTRFQHPDTKLETISLEQNVLESLLREQLVLKGQTIYYGCEITDYSNNPENTLTVSINSLAGTISKDTDLLIGCDGGKSTIRELSGIGFPGKTLSEVSFMSDCHLDSPLSHDWMHYFVTEEERLVIVPVPGERKFKISGNTRLPINHTPEEIIEHALTQNSLTSTRVIKLENFRFYKIQQRIATNFILDNIFLCGDAAHLFPPNGGQGLNTAMEDAAEVNNCIKAALLKQDRSLLLNYAGRREVACEKLKQTSAAKKRYSYRALSEEVRVLNAEQERIQQEEL